MINLGRVRPGSTIYIPFETFANSTGAPITLTGLATSDIQVYKDGGTTQRASASGYTLLDTDGIDFDGITGIHGFSIDLSDNTTADFWAAGSRYFVVVSTVTVDSQTMSFIAATFSIGYEGSWIDTYIATLASQTSFTLNAGPAEDNALVGHWAIIHDAASAVQSSRVLISAYTGASKTVTLAAGATFTAAAKDNISIMGMAPMQPATLGRQPVVDASGLVDANTVKVGPTGSGTAQTARDIGASVLLSSGTGTGQLDFTSGVVKSDVSKWLGTAASTPTVAGVPNVNVKTWNDLTTVALPLVPTTAGRTLDVSVGGEAGVDWANVGSPTTVVGLSGTTVKTATDVETDTADIQSRLPAALTAGGNIKADALAINAVATTSVTTINANVGTTNAINFFGSGVSGYVKADVRTVTGNAQSAGDIVNNQDIIYTAVTALPTAAQNADAVWDEAQSGHTSAGTFGKYLDAQVSTVGGGSLTAAAIADAVWDEEYTSHAGITGSTAELMSDINASTSALTSRITSSLFTGITSMAQWLGLMAGKQTPNSTALTEIKATGAGSGTYDATTDSLQAIRDSGGGSGASLTVDATYVDAAHTWTFPSAVQTTATRIINELIGFNGLACMDFTNVIPPEVAISSVDSATFANISGTEPTVGTTSVSTNLKKVLIPINATAATANTYTLSVTVTTTDSQQFTRKGQFTVA